jgi:hypothetical protein
MAATKGEGELVFGKNLIANWTLTVIPTRHPRLLTLGAPCLHCTEQVPCALRDLSLWSTQQKKSYAAVATRFKGEKAAYYSLLALGLVGSVRLAEFKETLQTDARPGGGIVL